MSQSIIPFIFMFVAMAVIAFSLMLYVYRKGKNSKGVYTAKALIDYILIKVAKC